MIREFVVLLILVSYIYGDNCVRYTFEEDFYELFHTDSALCDSRVPWLLERYKNTELTSPHVRSTKYISPQEITSCVSSFIFPMRFGGIVEVNAFIGMTDTQDALTITASTIINDSEQTAGTITITPKQHDHKPEWQTLRITLMGTDDEVFDGYVSVFRL